MSESKGRRRGREFYLHVIPLEEARAKWEEVWRKLRLRERLKVEEVPTQEALGRVAAESVTAAASSPHYHAAAMDGIAVRAADTAGASELTPRRLRVGAEAVYVNTGDPLPEGRDAVIMIEETAEVAEGELEIIAAAAPWQHTRVIGEDIVATEVIVPAGQRIRPVDIGALLAAGVLRVKVRARPRAAVIPTGRELVPPGEAESPGEIPDFNSPMIAASLAEDGAAARYRRPAEDSVEAIREEIERACESADLVLTIAGASAGSRDFTAEAIRTAGELLVHGIATRPGKPLALGVVRGKPVAALPGYPVSAMLCYDLFVAPLIAHMLGEPAPARPRVRVTLSRKAASAAGSDEFLRVRLGEVGGRIVAVPTARGAGLVSALARADGVVLIPRGSEGEPKGAEVACELLRPEHWIGNTVLVTGSHDVALDLLGEYAQAEDENLRIVSTHVGSMGGLAALKEGYCHLAGCHLLDPESGDYNRPTVRRLFGEEEISLVTLAHRQQGFMVPRGNPKGIRGWEDLARPEVRFVNRQHGAGTRVLLDYHLGKLGIPPERVQGYRREVYTHLAVASMVANGTADAGLGILAAARALGLDFVPLALERYDLAARPGFWEEPRGIALLRALRSEGFKKRLAALGGYDTRETGVTQTSDNATS